MSRDAHLLASDRDLLAQCKIDRVRGGGPGGQKRNKTSSAVRLRHQPTGLMVKVDARRSQSENQVLAIRRLREHIAMRVREPVDVLRYEPSAAAREAVARGPLSERAKTRSTPAYLAALAEILDVYVAAGCELRTAAAALDVSSNQLARLLRGDPRLARRTAELAPASGGADG